MTLDVTWDPSLYDNINDDIDQFLTPWRIHLSMNTTLINMGSIDTKRLQHTLSSQKNHSLIPLSMLILLNLLMTLLIYCIKNV
jgi:hypothetical protein